ncbi:arabinogalactan endo-1,4-beta-galactosidase [Arthrobacter oryzae]|uniref:Arabinogalactan endo-beta-1,4-galactanase n=2 Tax=Arthrobacter oryzae TaxID=409290 RepID=A0A495FMU0_9MICC|nr:arabinogalactan endo-1,4-beta-galactosidase [Arthrobacter oryzae]
MPPMKTQWLNGRIRMLPWTLPSLVATSVAVLGIIVATAAITRPATSPELEIRGADISFTLQEEANNQILSANGQTAPLETILAQHGANYARLRVWVNPPKGTSDLVSALTLARRAHAAGLHILLDLHYSDSWADRTTQQTPAAWQGQTLEQLRSTVETYTRDVVAAFARQATPVAMVQIGNETTHGMLWPTGQIYKQTGEDWTGYAELVKAGIRGAKEASPGNSNIPLIMLHSDTGGDRGASTYYFDHLRQQGVTFDVIGLTYYPFWNGSLASLQENLLVLADRYSKDILIAETAYPWTLSSGGGVQSVVTSRDALPDAAAYPPTPQGQAHFFEALNQILREVPNGHGVGYLIWEPGWLPGVPADARTGNSHSNLTLFDWWGHGLPALDAFRPTGTAGP